jgi:hypothetical protein
VFVQWKGTDVCLDFYCDCGPDGGGHYDGYFAYGVRCSACGRTWELPTDLTLTPGEPGVVQDTDMPHNDRRDVPREVVSRAVADALGELATTTTRSYAVADAVLAALAEAGLMPSEMREDFPNG